MRMAYINFLWIIFTFLGIGIFGFFPATTAMLAVMRKWLTGKQDIPVFKSFWYYYKNDFKQANILGYILIAVGLILYLDLKFFQTSLYPVFSLIEILIFILLFVYFVILLYIFPIFVYYKSNAIGYLKHSLVLAIGRPIQTIAMLIGFVLSYLLLNNIPGLIPFFGVSIFGLVLIWIAALSFPKLNKQG